MNSNYMFDFNRNSVAAPKAAPKAAAPVAVARDAPSAPSDRFSMNRLINFKSTGGCRSCN